MAMAKNSLDPQSRAEPNDRSKSGAEAVRVLVFVPTYNDNARAAEIALGISAASPAYRPLVVDDGSSPPLAPAAAGAGGLQVRLPDNFGLGAITHIAFDHALAAGYGAVVRIDGDGQHMVSDIPRLLAPIEDGSADLVVGIRVNHRLGSGGARWLRTGVKAYFSLLARIITGGRSPDDINTGFFAANRTAMATLSHFTLARFPEPQLFILACRAGLRVREVAVEQQDRLGGRSALGFSQGLRMFYRFNVFVINELLRGRRS